MGKYLGKEGANFLGIKRKGGKERWGGWGSCVGGRGLVLNIDLCTNMLNQATLIARPSRCNGLSEPLRALCENHRDCGKGMHEKFYSHNLASDRVFGI